MAGGTLNFTYQTGTKSIGGFEIDAFFVETYNFSNQMTNLTVEEGSNISDHVVDEPDTIDLEAYIGATKFETYQGEVPTDLSEVEIPDDPKSRIKQAYHELLRMKRAKQPLDVVTGLDTFTNMLIVSFSISRDVETGADLPFSMSLQKIETVKSEETQINASSSSASDQAGGTANVGMAGKNNLSNDENSMKEAWRRNVRYGVATQAEYQEQWGVPYPQ